MNKVNEELQQIIEEVKSIDNEITQLAQTGKGIGVKQENEAKERISTIYKHMSRMSTLFLETAYHKIDASRKQRRIKELGFYE